MIHKWDLVFPTKLTSCLDTKGQQQPPIIFQIIVLWWVSDGTEVNAARVLLAL